MGACLSKTLSFPTMTSRTGWAQKRKAPTNALSAGIPSGPGDGPECSESFVHSHEGEEIHEYVDIGSARHVRSKNCTTSTQVCKNLHNCCRLSPKDSKEPTDVQSNTHQRNVEALQHDLKEQADKFKALQITKANLETQLQASAREMQSLRTELEEKAKDMGRMEAERLQLMAGYHKLQAQLSTIEQRNAQSEALSSGSYADDHANPAMLEGACKVVDKATESLARFLHERSIGKSSPLDAENFVRRISSARPDDFSRAIQVKHAWAHWICVTMFRCFEHVHLDLGDDGFYTSPLDSKIHAMACFQSFQHAKGLSPLELSDGCQDFQAFFRKKYANLFPPWLVQLAFHDPKLPDDKEICNRVVEVAKAVWTLHHLAFSFNPPASILRMGRGTPYDKWFHDSVIADEGSGEAPQYVVLMTRPAFRLRNSIIRSRVFLSKHP